MRTDFPVTRTIIDGLDGWLDILAKPLLPLKRVPLPGGSFQWEFRERTPYSVQVAKAVRMISGTRAALFLAEEGYVTESVSLLRMVSDFSIEIRALYEGMDRGELTAAQRKFVDQFFKPLPRTLSESTAQDRERYVSREELLKSEARLANDAQIDGENFRNLYRALFKGYDAYVHGGYQTAMSLFSGRTNTFMLRGHEWEEARTSAKIAVSGKLHEVVTALECMALLHEDQSLRDSIREARHQLDASGEYSTDSHS